MTLLALIVAGWITLSVVTALAFGAVASAVERSEPALQLPRTEPLRTASAAPVVRSEPSPLPAQRRAGAPVLSA